MGRPFYSIPLGGMQNSDFLLGHEYTYEGSKPGRIVEILMEAGTMDPIIYFDELDKLSGSHKGDEIANLLCHLTDLSQNSEFQDKYFSGIKFDLSRAIFIFSYNDEKLINPILLDRMIKIHTTGFKDEDKITIAQDYLLPALCTSIGFEQTNVQCSPRIIRYIVEKYTAKEKGVRNLRRCLEMIVSKLNVLKLLHADPQYSQSSTQTQTKGKNKSKSKKTDSAIVDFDLPQFSLPFLLTEDTVEKLLSDYHSKSQAPPASMYL